MNPAKPEYLDLQPIRAVRGTVLLPGSKSITNRMLLLAAMAQGRTTLREVLESDDTRYMLAALGQLGVKNRQAGALTVEIEGGNGPFPVKKAELFLGNAGTAVRTLTAALAFCGGEYRVDGVARMHERPIGDLVDALRSLGAKIDYLGKDGFPPLAIHAGAIKAQGEVSIRGNVSSQYLTGLLMALPLLGAQTVVRIDGELISRPYIEITLNAMRRFGVAVQREGWNTFTVPAGARYASPGELYVEGDASSASYFLAAGAISGLTGGGPVRVQGVGRDSTQGDVRFADALVQMGAAISFGDNWIEATAGAEARQRGRLRGVELDCNHIPDAAMTLAVAALFAEGSTTLRNIASWRVKETDRIAAMARELAKLGAGVEEGRDSLKVTPPKQWQAATVDTYDDHRMAMCFSLAALGGVAVRINDPGCVAKTFPDYFRVLSGITEPA
jgi:3-phosphoshikimate 1-carboxyvinyltransferase